MALLILLTAPILSQPKPMPSLARVELNATEVIGPAQLQGRVYLANPAPQRGATIGLWSGSQVTIPTTVFVPQGATQATFTVQVQATSTPIDVVIRATAAGNVEVHLRVLPPPRLTGLKFDNQFGVAGQDVQGTVEVADAASTAGVLVSLSGGHTAQIPKGQVRGSFSVPTPPSDVDTTFELQASLGNQQASAQLKLYATPRVTAVEVAREVVAEEPTQAVIRLARPAPPGGARFAVRRNLSLKLAPEVSIQAGQSSGTLTFTAQPVKRPVLVDLEVGGTKSSFYVKPSPTVGVRDAFGYWLLANDKALVLDDPAAPGEQWKLAFEGGPRLEEASGKYLVQADFTGTLGADPTIHRVTLELTYQGADQEWKLIKTRIHSVNGNLRSR